MNKAREIACRIDPVLWVREILGVTPAPGRRRFCERHAGHPFLR